jgi:hypothetical protein
MESSTSTSTTTPLIKNRPPLNIQPTFTQNYSNFLSPISQLTQSPLQSYNMYSTNSNISPISFSNNIHYPPNQYSYSFTPNIVNVNQLVPPFTPLTPNLVNVNQLVPPPRPMLTIPLNPSSSINIQQDSEHINMYER